MNSKKKVLWTTNILMPGAQSILERGQGALSSGTWLSSLFNDLKKHLGEDFDFFVFSTDEKITKPVSGVLDGTEYYIAPTSKYSFLSRFKKEVAHLRSYIAEIRPDLIHVHGSEFFYGLGVDPQKDVAVLSIQGIREHIWKAYFSDFSFSKYAFAHLRKGKFFWIMVLWKQYILTKQEGQLLQHFHHFIGRTKYDHDFIRGKLPNSKYHGSFHDILRKEFYSEQWNIHEAEPASIMVVFSATPYKGLNLLIRAMGILKPFYPNLKLKIAGRFKGVLSSESLRLARKLNIEANIHFLGTLGTADLIKAYQSTRVFVNPSYVENESMALQEAQMLGVPSVASFIGGMTSTMKDRETGLAFPPGDPYMLAANLKELFEDDQLALRLSKKGREICQLRHNPETIVQRYAELYTRLTAPTLGEQMETL